MTLWDWLQFTKKMSKEDKRVADLCTQVLINPHIPGKYFTHPNGKPYFGMDEARKIADGLEEKYGAVKGSVV